MRTVPVHLSATLSFDEQTHKFTVESAHLSWDDRRTLHETDIKLKLKNISLQQRLQRLFR